MNNKIIGAIVLIVVIGMISVGYYSYGAYNETQTKNHLFLSDKYSDKAISNENIRIKAFENKDYDKYLNLTDNSTAYFRLAIDEDKQAQKTDNGDYKEYIGYDISRLEKNIELMETQKALVYTLRKGGNTMALDMKCVDLSNDAHDYRDKEDEIINMNPELFEFLN